MTPESATIQRFGTEAVLINKLYEIEPNDYIRLWKAVLMQALIDLTMKINPNTCSIKERISAMGFFEDKHSNLPEICDLADVCPGRYRNYGLQLIKRHSLITNAPKLLEVQNEQ